MNAPISTALVSTGLDATGVRTHPLCGPADRMPAAYRGPHRLSHGGWLDFTSRLERREEISLICSTTAANKRALDVGGGTGDLTRAVAVQLGHCTTVEPHSQRVATLTERAEEGGTGTIEIIPGHAESLPFPDASFDVVFATWILPYVDDLERSVAELARVCDRTDPEAKVVLIGGADDNELVSILNETCVPLAGEPHDHQGYLLATAAELLSTHGFHDFSLYRTEAALHFPEPDLDDRVRAATTTLVNFWYEDHPDAGAMRQAIAPALRRHFARRPHAIGDQGAVLVARPGSAAKS
ncbi:methyltransferase domain-containing protein [Kitasatospora sp. NPDC088351]|uniref:methyltransferase domain-containing protein n=1 Tax=unclassified Kitasatospora TaxID=2633591 RepID=UPI00341846D5